MTSAIGFVLALALVMVVVVAARQALVIFELRVDARKLTRARGRIPRALLNDLLVVCPHGHESTITIVCRIEQGRAQLVTHGPIDDDSIQRMRNLLGMYPLARLKTAPRLRD